MTELAIASDGHMLRVPVSTEAAESNEAWLVCMWPDHVVRTAVDEQGYEFDELPPNVVRAAMLWRYFGEFENGGHGGYWGNTCANTDMLRMASELLAVMGQHDYQILVDEFIEFIDRENDYLTDMCADDREPETRCPFYPFNDRLFALEKAGPGLTRLLRDWILQQSWVMLVPSKDHALFLALNAAIPAHLLKAEREAARYRRNYYESHSANTAFLVRLLEYLKNPSSEKRF